MRRMFSENQLQEQVKNQLAEGNVNNVKIFENIVDKEGHARFIEGDGIVSTLEGLETTYCKWSLSGTHLMLVWAGNIADTTVVPDNSMLVRFNLPQWILDKIYPVWANTAIEVKQVKLYSDSWTYQTLDLLFLKAGTEYMAINSVGGGVTLTADRGFRVSFDLLIDNE